MRILRAPRDPGLTAAVDPSAARRLREEILAADTPDSLVAQLGRVTVWPLEELVDLECWIGVLDALDALLEGILGANPGLVLVWDEMPPTPPADPPVLSQRPETYILEALRFSALLLDNAMRKEVYDSVEHLSNLLGAASEDLAEAALQVLSVLAPRPAYHRLMVDETYSHQTTIRRHPHAPAKVLTLAQGWGNAAQGLALGETISSPSSESVPESGMEPGSGAGAGAGLGSSEGIDGLEFTFFARAAGEPDTMRTLRVSAEELASAPSADLFARLVEEHAVPEAKRFPLLAQLRLCRKFATKEGRLSGVTCRLQAILTAVNAHPSGNALSNYFTAQPELVNELVGLIKSRPAAEAPPMAIRVLVMEILRDLIGVQQPRALEGITVRHVNVLQELGVARGHFTGLLPSLVRQNIASLAGPSPPPGSGSLPPTAAVPAAGVVDPNAFDMSVGLSFVEAAEEAPPMSLYQGAGQYEFLEALFSLLFSVTSDSTGAAAMSDSGILSGLLGMVQHATAPLGSLTLAQSRFVLVQAIYAIENTIVTHYAASSIFRDLNGGATFAARLELEVEACLQARTGAPDEEAAFSHVVLINTLMNILTSMQQFQGAPATAGSDVLRNTTVTGTLVRIFHDATYFGSLVIGGAIAFLTEALNDDPSCITFVHESHVAGAFLDALREQRLQASTDVVCGVPSLLHVLALPSANAQRVRQAEPFEALFELLLRERCGLSIRYNGSDTANQVGSALEDLMRSVTDLQDHCMSAMVQLLDNLVYQGETLHVQLAAAARADGHESPRAQAKEVEMSGYLRRVTFALEIIEPLMNRTDQAESGFLARDGLAILLRLMDVITPATGAVFQRLAFEHHKFLTYGYAHAPAAAALSMAVKGLATQVPQKVLKSLLDNLGEHLETIQRVIGYLGRSLERCPEWQAGDVIVSDAGAFAASDPADDYLRDLRGVLDRIPIDPMHLTTPATPAQREALDNYAALLMHLTQLEWHLQLLAEGVKAAQSRSHFRWASDFSKRPGGGLWHLDRAIALYTACQAEACRAEERLRRQVEATAAGVASRPAKVWLRICHRDGAHVYHGRAMDAGPVFEGGALASGGYVVERLPCGSVVEATDACVVPNPLAANKGVVASCETVLRFRVASGWVSAYRPFLQPESVVEVLGASSGSEAPGAAGAAEAGLAAEVSYLRHRHEEGLGKPQKAATFLRFRRFGARGPREIGIQGFQRLHVAVKHLVATLARMFILPARGGYHASRHDISLSSWAMSDFLAATLDAAAQSAAQAADRGAAYALAQRGLVLDLATVILHDDKRRMVNSVVLHSMHQRKSLDLLLDTVFATLDAFLQRNGAGSRLPEAAARQLWAAEGPLRLALNYLQSLCSRRTFMDSAYTRALVRSLGPNASAGRDDPFDADDFYLHLQGLLFSRGRETCRHPRLSRLTASLTCSLLPFLYGLRAASEEVHRAIRAGPSLSERELRRQAGAGRDEHADRAFGRLAQYLGGRGIRRVEPDEAVVNQLIEMGFARDHIEAGIHAVQNNRPEIIMEYLVTHAAPAPTRPLPTPASVAATAANDAAAPLEDAAGTTGATGAGDGPGPAPGATAEGNGREAAGPSAAAADAEDTSGIAGAENDAVQPAEREGNEAMVEELGAAAAETLETDPPDSTARVAAPTTATEAAGSGAPLPAEEGGAPEGVDVMPGRSGSSSPSLPTADPTLALADAVAALTDATLRNNADLEAAMMFAAVTNNLRTDAPVIGEPRDADADSAMALELDPTADTKRDEETGGGVKGIAAQSDAKETARRALEVKAAEHLRRVKEGLDLASGILELSGADRAFLLVCSEAEWVGRLSMGAPRRLGPLVPPSELETQRLAAEAAQELRLAEVNAVAAVVRLVRDAYPTNPGPETPSWLVKELITKAIAMVGQDLGEAREGQEASFGRLLHMILMILRNAGDLHALGQGMAVAGAATEAATEADAGRSPVPAEPKASSEDGYQKEAKAREATDPGASAPVAPVEPAPAALELSTSTTTMPATPEESAAGIPGSPTHAEVQSLLRGLEEALLRALSVGLGPGKSLGTPLRPVARLARLPSWVESCLLLLDVMATRQPTTLKGAGRLSVTMPSRSEYTKDDDSRGSMAPLQLEKLNLTAKGESEAAGDTPKPDDVGPSAPAGADAPEMKLATFLSPKSRKLVYEALLRILKLSSCASPGLRATAPSVGRRLLLGRGPVILQVALQLLTRLLRDFKYVAAFVDAGGIAQLLRLSPELRFPGHVSMLVVLLRRCLEDCAALQHAMETDIRSQLPKLAQRERHRPHTEFRVPLPAFLSHFAAAACRDPRCFRRAMENVCELVRTPNSAAPGASEYARFEVVLKGANAASGSAASGETPAAGPRPAKASSGAKEARDSSPLHRRRPTAQRSGVSMAQRLVGDVGSYIIDGYALLKEVGAYRDDSFAAGRTIEAPRADLEVGFVRVDEALDLLSDLTLAFPSCATAIHRFYLRQQPSEAALPAGATPGTGAAAAGGTPAAFWLEHGLRGAAKPTPSFINFLLHELLTTPRGLVVFLPKAAGPHLHDAAAHSTPPRDEQALWRNREVRRRIRLVQRAARLVVVLCARPGEGRRRVVADVTRALRGLGGDDAGKASDPLQRTNTPAMKHGWAMRSWGELVLGLLTPKPAGGSDSSSRHAQPCWEMLKVMVEAGLTQSLTHALGAANLELPRASRIAAALLEPLEVLTRASVTERLQELCPAPAPAPVAAPAAAPAPASNDAPGTPHRAFGGAVEAAAENRASEAVTTPRQGRGNRGGTPRRRRTSPGGSGRLRRSSSGGRTRTPAPAGTEGEPPLVERTSLHEDSMLGEGFAEAAPEALPADESYETHYIRTADGDVIEVRIEEGDDLDEEDDSGDDIIIHGGSDDMSDDDMSGDESSGEDDEDGVDDDDEDGMSDDDGDEDEDDMSQGPAAEMMLLANGSVYLDEESDDDSDAYQSSYGGLEPELFPNSDMEGDAYFGDAGAGDPMAQGEQHEVYWGDEDTVDEDAENAGDDALFSHLGEGPPMPPSPGGGPFVPRLSIVDNGPEGLGLNLGLGMNPNEAMGQGLLAPDPATGAGVGGGGNLQDMFMNLVLGANNQGGLLNVQGGNTGMQVVQHRVAPFGAAAAAGPGGTRMVFREHPDGRLTFESVDPQGFVVHPGGTSGFQTGNDEGLAGEMMFPRGAAALTHDAALHSAAALAPSSLAAQTQGVLTAAAAVEGNPPAPAGGGSWATRPWMGAREGRGAPRSILEELFPSSTEDAAVATGPGQPGQSAGAAALPRLDAQSVRWRDDARHLSVDEFRFVNQQMGAILRQMQPAEPPASLEASAAADPPAEEKGEVTDGTGEDTLADEAKGEAPLADALRMDVEATEGGAADMAVPAVEAAEGDAPVATTAAASASADAGGAATLEGGLAPAAEGGPADEAAADADTATNASTESSTLVDGLDSGLRFDEVGQARSPGSAAMDLEEALEGQEGARPAGEAGTPGNATLPAVGDEANVAMAMAAEEPEVGEGPDRAERQAVSGEEAAARAPELSLVAAGVPRDPAQDATVAPPTDESGGEAMNVEAAAAPTTVVPEGMDPEVFAQLPEDMQRELIAANPPPAPAGTAPDPPAAGPAGPGAAADDLEARAIAAGMDPEVVAALPPEMREEVLGQATVFVPPQVPIDPANAEDMDTGSIMATLDPALRAEILLEASPEMLRSLPPDLRAEAMSLRDRAAAAQGTEDFNLGMGLGGMRTDRAAIGEEGPPGAAPARQRRAQKVERWQKNTMVVDTGVDAHGLVRLNREAVQALLTLTFLCEPVRPTKLKHRLFLNLLASDYLRQPLLTALVQLLHGNSDAVRQAVNSLESDGDAGPPPAPGSRPFPPQEMIGLPSEEDETGVPMPSGYLPVHGKRGTGQEGVPSVVARRLLDVLHHAVKNHSRILCDTLRPGLAGAPDRSFLVGLLELLGRPGFVKSGACLELLLQLLDQMVRPLTDIEDEAAAAAAAGAEASQENAAEGDASGPTSEERESEEYKKAMHLRDAIPRPVIAPKQLRLLCGVLRAESCSDEVLSRVASIAHALACVKENKAALVAELSNVAQLLGSGATKELRQLRMHLQTAVADRKARAGADVESGIPTSAMALAASAAEVKMVRVLQTLTSLFDAESPAKTRRERDRDARRRRREGRVEVRFVQDPAQLATLYRALTSLELSELWDDLSDCLAVVSVLEGIANEEDYSDASGLQGRTGNTGGDTDAEPDESKASETGASPERRQRSMSESSADGGPDAEPEPVLEAPPRVTSSMAGVLARFLPMIEVFFMVNATANMHPKAKQAAREDEMSERIDAGPSSTAVTPLPIPARFAAPAEPAAGETTDATQQAAAHGADAAGRGDPPLPPDNDHLGDNVEPGAHAEPGLALTVRQEEAPSDGAAEPMDAVPRAKEESLEDEVASRLRAGLPLRRMQSLPGAKFRRTAAYAQRMGNVEDGDDVEDDAGVQRCITFMGRHRTVLNVLLRQNPTLLERSLASIVRIPACRLALSFDIKRTYFRNYMRRLRHNAHRRHGSLRVPVHRTNIFQDSFRQLRHRNAEEMRGRIHISFVGEDGIDAGGLTREWYSVLAREMFNPDYCLFIPASDGATMQPNPLSKWNPEHLDFFKFIGRIIGKALADGQLLEAHFTRSFYKHILGAPVDVEDMQSIDPDYFNNLKQILEYPVEALGLDLSFTMDRDNFGRVESIELVPGGAKIAVTDLNKAQYVQQCCHSRMTTAIRKQVDAFLDGFHQLIPAEVISLFTPKELELLICGMPNIDLDDLEANTEYEGFRSSDENIRWFWNALRSLSQSERALFLQFVTGTSKVPLGGFSQLQGMRGNQRMAIHRAHGSSALLPTAHTCFNQLDLPRYQSEEETVERIKVAIKEGAEGFGFG